MPRQSDSRERLLQAAADLIWKGSYYGTSVDQICETTGLKKGSFYHHFESKEQLVTVALDRTWEEFAHFLDNAFLISRPPLDRFRFYAQATVDQQTELKARHGFVLGCPLFSLGTEIGGQEPALRAKIDSQLTLLGRYYTGTLKEAQMLVQIPSQDLSVLSEQVMSLVKGAMTLARIRNDLTPLRGIESGILRLVGAPAERPLEARS